MTLDEFFDTLKNLNLHWRFVGKTPHRTIRTIDHGMPSQSGYAKKKIWINGKRCLCELETDGSVTFKDDVSFEELKWAVGALLRDAEYKRQCRIGLEGEEAEQALDKIKKIDQRSAQNLALDEMVRLNQEMGLYDNQCPNPLIKVNKDVRCDDQIPQKGGGQG